MSLLKLRRYQQEALDAIDKSLQEHTRVAAVIPTGGGKGHPLDTEVPTPDGLRLWGDLQVGDYVYGSYGQPTKVTAIFDRGVLPVFTVAFRHGESVQVDGEHLWQVQRKGRKPEVVSTAELMTRKLKDRDGYCWATPVAEAVWRPHRPLPLHPYVVGSLIANGGMTHSGTQLSTPDPEVALRIAEHTKINPVQDTTPGVCPRYSLPGLTEVTRELGLRVRSIEKRIPRLYLEASEGQRLALLHGLMDGDGGSRTGGRRSVNYFTGSLELAFDVKELVTSLGGTCTISQHSRREPREYKCGILMPSETSPFSTSRRIQFEGPHRVFEPRSAIVSIFRSGEAEIRCITVEAEDSLYCITRNHIVTHNTVVFAHLIDRETRAGRKALVLVHREELAEQAKTKIHSVAPDLSVGIVKAERNEVDADVIVASVQTLVREERRRSIMDAGAIGIVIVDECHHAVARTWMEVLADFGCFSGADGTSDLEAELMDYRHTPTPCVGFTATLTRNDGKGLGDVWETVAFERDINWMIDHGYLTDVRGQAITVDGLDLATIARSKGDYQEGQLGDALIESGAAEVVARAYVEHATSNDERGAYNVKQGVLFAPTVASAYAFAEALNDVGLVAATVEGNLSTEERALIYKRYEAGEINVLANCMVLTEGWDAPWAEVCVVARPTQSAALYTQMVGRVLRPWQGKDEALVLDVVGIAGAHKLRSLTDLVKTTVLDGESYAEARDRVERENAERIGAITKISGLVKAQQVELFANSHSTWLMTKGGKWFIPTTHGLFFLWPAIERDTVGTWRLGYVESKRGGPRKPGWIQQNMTLEYAMAWGEQMAELDDPTVSLKDRAWRRTKPSEGQIAMATRLKVAPIDELMAMRKGAVSDLISIHLASNQLDR